MTRYLRWNMALLITAAIAISYFDRQTLPIAIHAIQREFPVTNTQFSHLQAAFLAAYALMYAGSGKLLDVFGTRKGFLLIMLWWSLACASQGLATSVPLLAVSLFLLGVGEGGGFPAATKAMAEWFPASERSSAMGLMNAGTAVGAVAAPPLIALILLHLRQVPQLRHHRCRIAGLSLKMPGRYSASPEPSPNHLIQIRLNATFVGLHHRPWQCFRFSIVIGASGFNQLRSFSVIPGIVPILREIESFNAHGRSHWAALSAGSRTP